jgi:hypothetical protein
MAQAKDVPKAATKKAAPRTRKAAVRKTAARKASTAKPAATPARKPGTRVAKKVETKAVTPPTEPLANSLAAPVVEAEIAKTPSPDPAPEPATVAPDPQSQVVASKFASVEPAPPKAPRRALPSTYGESRLLLLVRDPQTLFAAWDVSPATIEGLKGRLGRRGFAVSTQTLHVTRSDGSTSVVHAGKKARSRYVKIEGGPSFVAEIGFTTPAGRFEFVARSAPCFVPMGPLGRGETTGNAARTVLGYREAGAHRRRGGLLEDQAGAAARDRAQAVARDGVTAAQRAARELGGASDLYRR